MNIKNTLSDAVLNVGARAAVCLGLLFGLALSALAATTTLPIQGSWFTSTNVGGTNVIWMPPATSTTTLVTNLPAAVASAVDITGNNGVLIIPQTVQVAVGGNTNNGGLYLNFALSNDGVNYTTASNGFQVYVPSSGTTYQIIGTNVASTVIGNAAYVKLLSMAHTNIGGVWVSNISYRFLQTR